MWVAPNNCDLKAQYAEGGEIQTALVGVEALRALKMACDNAKLSKFIVGLWLHNNFRSGSIIRVHAHARVHARAHAHARAHVRVWRFILVQMLKLVC